MTLNANGTSSVLIDQITLTPIGAVQSWIWKLGGVSRPYLRVYDTSGRLVRQALGNLIRDITYDSFDRVSGYTHYFAATAQPASAFDQRFSYDELDRLTSATGSSSWTYSYDQSGNRTSAVTSGAHVRNYAVATASNRLDAVNNPLRSFAYDAAGNTSSDTQAGSSANYNAVYGLEGRLVVTFR